MLASGAVEQRLAQGIPLFEHLPAPDLELLTAQLRRRCYGPGETIVAQGERRTGLYIVAYGEVKLEMVTAEGQESILGFLGPGDFFGELSLLDGEAQMSDAVARQQTEL